MLKREALVHASQWVIDVTTLRAEGIRLGIIARRVGQVNSHRLTASLRAAYQEELGVNNSVAAAHELNKAGLIDLTSIGLQSIPPLSRLDRADRIFITNFTEAPPAHLAGNSLKQAERDFRPVDPDDLATRLQAHNMTHLLAIGHGLDSVGRLSLIDGREISQEEAEAALKRPEPPKLHPITPKWLYPDQPEKQPKLFNGALNETQEKIMRMTAIGYRAKDIQKELDIVEKEYHRQLRAMFKHLGLKTSEGLSKADAKELAYANLVIVVNALITSKEINAKEVVEAVYGKGKAKDIIEDLQDLSPLQRRTMMLLAEGKTTSSIVAETAQSEDNITIALINQTPSNIYSRIGALSRPHMAALVRSAQQIEASRPI